VAQNIENDENVEDNQEEEKSEDTPTNANEKKSEEKYALSSSCLSSSKSIEIT